MDDTCALLLSLRSLLLRGASIAALICLQACSLFTPPAEQPVIEEKLNSSLFKDGKVGTLSLTPERRVVLVNFASDRFCAEAPTEVGQDISRVLQATASADIPSEVKAKIGVAMALASTNTVLNRRTQGMQLFLANSYFVCQMYMNKAIDEKQLIEYQLSVFDKAASLIERELPYLGSPRDSAGATPSSKFDANKALKDILGAGEEKTDADGDGEGAPNVTPPPKAPPVEAPAVESPATDPRPESQA